MANSHPRMSIECLRGIKHSEKGEQETTPAGYGDYRVEGENDK